MKTSKEVFASLLLFSFVSSLISCATDVVTGKRTLNYFSLASDVKLGQQVIGEQLKDLQRSKKKLDEEADPQEFQRLRRIVQKIASVSHIPNFPYEVHLADVKIVNAWCAPGGKVMVYTGLWDPKEGLVQKGSEAELAAVIGHEISHATARHVTETLSKITTIEMAGAIAASAITKAGSPQGSDLFQRIYSQGMNVYVPSYSRQNESEADRIGIFYMAKAGYNPEAAVKLWERAAQKKGDQTSIYASHPASGERAKALKTILPAAMEVYHEAIKARK